MANTSASVMMCGLVAVGLAGCASTGPAAAQEPAAAAQPEFIVSPEPDPRAERMAMAEAATAAGEYEAALALLREILARSPTYTPAYIRIGEIYLATEDYARAEPVYARAARLEPRSYEAQYGHGFSLQMLDRFVEAVKAYHRALTIRPDSVEANFNLATTYLEVDEPKSALIFAEKAVELDPAHGPAHANLGRIYERIGRPGDAVVQYEAAIELMEPTPALLMNFINALSQEKRYVDARNTAEWLIRMAPSADAWERLGWASFRLARYDESIDAYRKAVELDSRSWAALNGIGCNALNTWLLSGRKDADAITEARQAFRRSLRLNPDQPKVVELALRYGL